MRKFVRQFAAQISNHPAQRFNSSDGLFASEAPSRENSIASEYNGSDPPSVVMRYRARKVPDGYRRCVEPALESLRVSV